MAHQCPICSKNFTTKITLRNHTGINDAALRGAHTCHKCQREFCSQKSMEQHLDGPSHSAMFSCDVRKKPFGSKQAIEQHEKTTSHKQMLARTNSVTGAGASSGSGNASFYQAQSRSSGMISTSIEPVWDDDDQDWILCDKDCGWCGHCADGVDY